MFDQKRIFFLNNTTRSVPDSDLLTFTLCSSNSS